MLAAGTPGRSSVNGVGVISTGPSPLIAAHPVGLLFQSFSNPFGGVPFSVRQILEGIRASFGSTLGTFLRFVGALAQRLRGATPQRVFVANGT